jgi:hypothetical protein
MSGIRIPVPAPSWSTGAAHVFYTTGEDLEELLDNIGTIPHYDNTEDPERFLNEQKEEDGDGPEYWERVQIFKVTIERIPRSVLASAAGSVDRHSEPATERPKENPDANG